MSLEDGGPSSIPPPEYSGSTGYALLLAVVAALGGLLFGYDTAVVAGAIGYLKEFMHLTDTQEGWAVASVLVGCAVGAAVAGPLSDYLGRKRLLIATAVLFAVSAVWSAMPDTLTQFVIARMLGGLAVGAAALVAPMYIAEVAPAGTRGRLVALQQIAIISGMLVVSIVNWQIALLGDASWNVTTGWRWMFASETLPAVLFLFCLILVPESPRWLIKNGRDAVARRVLVRVAGPARAAWEMDDIHRTLAAESGSLAELLAPGYRKILILAVVLAVLQQVTGINAIVYYTPKIFESSGTTDTVALLRTAEFQLTNLLFTLLAVAVIDRLGRKPLLLCTSALMGTSLVLLGWAFHQKLPDTWVFAFVLAYIASFAIGMGPVVWVVLSEIFPTRTRGLAMGIATVALWLANFVVSQTAPMMYERWGPASAFWIYAVMCLVSLVFVWLVLPETKGKTLEELERELILRQ